MSKVDREDSWLLFVAVVALAAFVAWKFAAYLGLEMAVAGPVLARLAVLAVLTGLSWRVAGDIPALSPKAVWPFLLALLWLCWWPALDFCAAKELSSSSYEDTLPWWAAWYTKGGVLVGLVGLGYLVRNFFGRY